MILNFTRASEPMTEVLMRLCRNSAFTDQSPTPNYCRCSPHHHLHTYAIGDMGCFRPATVSLPHFSAASYELIPYVERCQFS